MLRKEVYENLCVYDPRSGFYQDMIANGLAEQDEIPDARKPTCFCDNCFKGKDKLAVEILRLMDIVEDSTHKLHW